MGKIGGYKQRILRINLATKKFSFEPLNMEWARKYVGGKGLGARILYDELKPKADPLSPDNKIIVMTGPFQGTFFPGSSRCAMVTKSPLTGIWLDTYAGGDFGAELKYAGYDIAIIEGKADEPTYLWIDDENVEFRSAKKLWGTGCWDTEDAIKEELGDDEVRVACIGPAGENLVKFACISTKYYRQFGRGGAGAVLGSKNLKAIALRGSGSVEVADPEKFEEAADEALRYIMEKNEEYIFGIGGTGTLIDYTNPTGSFPTRNFSSGYFEEAEKLSLRSQHKHRLRERACFGCPVACGQFIKMREGKYAGTAIEGPEYETSCLLGSNLGVSDIGAIAKANELCDNLGLDTISTGGTIAWAMECYEKGIFTSADTGGIDLRFGNGDAVVQIVERIAKREGIGNILAEGTRIASKKVGKGSEDFAVNVKGLELPAYHPGVSYGMALAYAVNPRGGCHLSSWPIGTDLLNIYPLGWVDTFGEDRRYVKVDPQKSDYKAELVYSDHVTFRSRFCFIICDFHVLPLEIHQKAMIACTGFDEYLDKNEFTKLGLRMINVLRLFNLREGLRKEDELKLPKRIYEPIPYGPSKGFALKQEEMDKMLADYYKLMKWDENGIPTKETLTAVGITDLEPSTTNLAG